MAVDIDIRDLRPGELPAAVGVLARGMRDNPLHVAAYGADPRRRLRCHAQIMRGLFATSSRQQPICAVRGETILGVMGVSPPGACQAGPGQKLRQLPGLLLLGLPTSMRVLRWVTEWSARDLAEPHVHLGPLAVDAHLQGQGVGTLIMRAHCDRLDQDGLPGYLETDKQQNVAFYRRFGYAVIDEGTVLGVPSWYMRRAPR
ncbi:acetyltransferase (GNAT) family protein [Nonomuraea polychroma]|uniref:Acetyltransferase (GNAT) family protein n=1 Tax=Nonomuraea polychroma TaxID=46176 RepID=A0A438M734_9ACTN|nr:GNAT family N-acetyltransferase [Nonomuraea polychroma]RVX41415.1 acetyltransferase (GNAT) family protein [Nonomuraea polychroma]